MVNFHKLGTICILERDLQCWKATKIVFEGRWLLISHDWLFKIKSFYLHQVEDEWNETHEREETLCGESSLWC